MDKSELLHWLSKQEAAWTEMCSFFDTTTFEDVLIDELIECIEDDDDLYERYGRYFGNETLYTE